MLINTSSKIGAELAQRFTVKHRGAITVNKIAVVKTYQELRLEQLEEAERVRLANIPRSKGLQPVVRQHVVFGKRR